MGNTVSSSEATATITIQVPVEESVFPPGQNQYSLRDSIDQATDSSSLKIRYGYMIDDPNSNNNSPINHHHRNENSTTTNQNNNTETTTSTTSTFHCASGRMMKTFPLRTVTKRHTSSSSNNQSNNTSYVTNTPNSTTAMNSSHNQTACTAVVKTTWILEQVVDHSSRISYRTTTWLEEQVLELQRIRKVTRHLSNVASYQLFVMSDTNNTSNTNSNNNNNNSNNKSNIIVAPKSVVQNVMMTSLSQKYYLPDQHPTRSSSSTTSSSSATTNGFIMNMPVSVRAIYLVRSYVYTTLADRLSCRPFLTHIEKLYITYQILIAIHQLHQEHVIHGFITTENIGLSSMGNVILLDIASYKPRTKLPDDDPSEYIYYYQPQILTTTSSSAPVNTSIDASAATTAATTNQQQPNYQYNNNSTRRNNTTTTAVSTNHEKRCYLAPERFFTPSSSTSINEISKVDTTTITTISSPDPSTSNLASNHNNNHVTNREPPLTEAMDIFSLGCTLIELFLNGERCFDLGDIMEYRKLNRDHKHMTTTDRKDTTILPNSIQQKLNKIESSTIRAACKHMISYDPNQRLSAIQYYHRLRDNHVLVPSFDIYTHLIQQMTLRPTTNLTPQHHHIPPATKSTNTSMTGVDTQQILSDTKILDFTSSDISEPVYPNNTTGTFIETKISEDFSLSSILPVCLISPDARITILAMYYQKILYETMGICYTKNQKLISYNHVVIGPTLQKISSTSVNHNDEVIAATHIEEKKDDERMIGSIEYTDRLFRNVEALLKDLDSDVIKSSSINMLLNDQNVASRQNLIISHEWDLRTKNVENTNHSERSDLCKSSLLIYLQMILSTLRHAQRPISKVIALQLVYQLLIYCSDDSRLQRIVPIAVSLLHDQDPIVRAMSVQIITLTLSMIETFPPSDSKIFSQYVFKRVTHMISDPSILVRVTFAKCIGTLAIAAQGFLDISHAVRICEAVDNGTGGSTSRDEYIQRSTQSDNDEEKESSTSPAVFKDDVVKLLDKDSLAPYGFSFEKQIDGRSNQPLPTMTEPIPQASAKTLINSTYAADLAALQETISRWFIHIATDQSEHSSLPKRAVLSDLNRLCIFFGLEGVTSFILPQILAFLNDRKDWELRASLFQHLPTICQSIGRAATEEFVLPCIEIGLVDSEDSVICCALSCLSRIATLRLLSRYSILGNSTLPGARESASLLRRYGPLLLYPLNDVRQHAIGAFVSLCNVIGAPDMDVHLIPLLGPFVRSHVNAHSLTTEDGFKASLRQAWTWDRLHTILDDIKRVENNNTWTPGAWTSIGVTESDVLGDKSNKRGIVSTSEATEQNDPEELAMREYLKMLSRHWTQSSSQDRSSPENSSFGLCSGIEGTGKLTQSIMFPKQSTAVKRYSLPEWYSSLRDIVQNSKSDVSESVSIRSVAALGHIYGLSIMGIEGFSRNDLGLSDEIIHSEKSLENVLCTNESKAIEGAIGGEWGSESFLDPEIIDTTYLITKLKALGVPPLPVNFGNSSTSHSGRSTLIKNATMTSDWKPRAKTLLASSATINGHTAPISRLAVSMDQTFFVSSSHDGTCRVWEAAQMDDTGGLLESSVVYKEHSCIGTVRINDVAMLEGTSSVISGASDGSVHVWRVDMLKSAGINVQYDIGKYGRSRCVGSSSVRSVDTNEGETLAVTHFNSLSASIIAFGTQLGIVHFWDLRCATEPFKLRHSPELGYLSSMALGSDRTWVVSGSSKGYVALWDIRFQKCVNLWRHSSGGAIRRLATSTAPVPDFGGTGSTTSAARPFIFTAAGVNECSMFDVFSGSCTECFRTVVGDNRNLNSHVDDPPKLSTIPFTASRRSGMVKPISVQTKFEYIPTISTINCMVGSIGNSNGSYLITGGNDSSIRFWDFTSPSKCFTICGTIPSHSRPTYERIDFDGQCRLMMCRQAQPQGFNNSNKLAGRILHGLKKVEPHHTDAINDVKVLDNNRIVSCSRDCTIKVWR